MPTYEYKCKSCQKHWEQEQRITEDPVTECPHCHSQEAKRLISKTASFQLMGGGWAGEGYSK